MKRIRPCEFCKQRRRKCERPLGSTSCTRCLRLNLECVFDTTAPTNMRYNTSSSRRFTAAHKGIVTAPISGDWDMTEVDGDEELQDLCEHVKTLELELQQLQQRLDGQSQRSTPFRTSTAPVSSVITTLATAQSMVADDLPIPKEWNLTIVNGHLRLETGINTLSDLMQYGLFNTTSSSRIPYLSPFGSDSTVHFELKHDSMISQALFILRKHGIFNNHSSLHNPNNFRQTHPSQWGHRHQSPIDYQHDLDHPLALPSTPFSPIPSSSMPPSDSSSCCSDSAPPIQLSATMNHCPESIVDQLVQQYFLCHNPTMPLLHEATFMTHYTKQPGMTDPTRSGTTTTATTATSSPSSASTFYSTSTSPASPSSPTSTASTSTTNGFISPHNPVTLAICCFMSVSYCSHIPFTSHQKREYGEYFYVACREQIDDLFDDPSPLRQLEALMSINFLYKFMLLTLQFNDARKLATLGFLIANGLSKQAALQTFSIEEKELASRHKILASMTFGAMEFLCVKRLDDITPKKVPLTPLPGESAMTVSVLHLYQYLFDLILHHDCVVIMQQIQRVIIGEVGQVTLELMVRFEQTCLDWWRNLPKKWRYCEHPYDTSAKHAIEQCDYDQALMAHNNLLAMTLGVYTNLLYPQTITNQVVDMIQKRAMMMTLNCCELIIVVADRLKVVSNFCGYACDYALRVCDCLQNLFIHSKKTSDKSTLARILKYIERCYSDLNCDILTDHRVPSEMSLVSSPSNTVYSETPVIYTNYPLPAHALVFDVISSSAKNIGHELPEIPSP